MIKDHRIQYPARYHVVWEELFDFATDTAIRLCEDLKGKTYAEPLAFLVGAEYPNNKAAAAEGATYKSLAYVAHRIGMNAEERTRWYGLARRRPWPRWPGGGPSATSSASSTTRSGPRARPRQGPQAPHLPRSPGVLSSRRAPGA